MLLLDLPDTFMDEIAGSGDEALRNDDADLGVDDDFFDDLADFGDARP